jgi:ABC-type glycerol-3-phosphate transport system substrate-binding protein
MVAALVFSACGPVTAVPDTSPTPEPIAATGTAIAVPTATPTSSIKVDPASLAHVRIQVWHAFSGASAQAFTSKLARFNSTNEWGITVDEAPQGDYPSLFQVVTAALTSGPPPDLVVAPPEQALAWDAAGAVVDLTSYVGDLEWGLTGSEVADFPAVIWQQDEVDGRRLGVPAERSARFLFYNLTWARELGFDHPPATDEEFRQQACAANASFRTDSDQTNDGYGGWIVDADWMTVYPWLLAFGGGVVVPVPARGVVVPVPARGVTNEGGYRFQTDQNLAALEFLKTLKDDACAWMTADPENPFALNPGPFYEQFAHRSALFITGDLTEAAAFSNALTRLGSSDEWTMIPFPGPQVQAVTVYGPSYTLLQSTPEKQLAAWLFVRWLLSPENQAGWVEAAGTLPLRTAALDLLAAYRSAHPQWDAAVKTLPLAHGVPQRADWRTLRYVLADGTLSIFRMDVPVAEIPGVLAEMDATAEELSK